MHLSSLPLPPSCLEWLVVMVMVMVMAMVCDDVR
jgi:hypothetical protein